MGQKGLNLGSFAINRLDPIRLMEAANQTRFLGALKLLRSIFAIKRRVSECRLPARSGHSRLGNKRAGLDQLAQIHRAD